MDPADQPRRRRRRSSRLVLLVVSLGATLLLLGGLELVLRATDVGAIPPWEASRLRYQQVYPPMLEPGRRPDGTPALVTNDRRVPWQAVAADKPAGALRVVAVGGSATAGLGYSPNVTFTRQLERLLGRVQPEREVELVNLGIVALSSSQVRWIVDDVCRHLDPDVVLVYSGNNEFLEIHAEKYVELTGGRDSGPLATLSDTNLFRLVNGLVKGRPDGRHTTVHDMASANARVAESELVSKVDLSGEEIDGLVATYEDNLRAMVASAAAHDVELVLMTVAANWEWRGTEDLPADWIAAERGLAADDLAGALAAVEADLPDAGRKQRGGLLYRKAWLLDRLGRTDEATAAYRASMNADHHLRRATDVLAERVRAVAADTGAPLLDTVAALEVANPDGRVGFDDFYDYVHMTPLGALRVAALCYRQLAELGHVPADPGFDLGGWVAAEQARVEALERDPAAVGDWLGLGADMDLLHDRDLWKHATVRRSWDAHLAEHPDDVDVLVWRANADFFLLGGYRAAEAGYERALELAPDHAAARANLERLRGDRRP